MLLIHETGSWRPGQILIEWVPSSWPGDIAPVNGQIERAWDAAKRRLGDKLFDGPMCRMESWSRDDASGALRLRLSTTSYRIFLGTNLTNAHLADQYGVGVLARPVGVSPALVSADNWLMLGRRNASVAYYPNRVHPFAGALEPRENVTPFDEVRRELREELSLGGDDVSDIVCTGIVEDTILRHPEMIFAARSTLTRGRIEAQVDEEEHHDSFAVRATAEEVERALVDSGEPFTPVARATILLFGRIEFGQDWLDRVREATGI
jgi:hypothetical protein